MTETWLGVIPIFTRMVAALRDHWVDRNLIGRRSVCWYIWRSSASTFASYAWQVTADHGPVRFRKCSVPKELLFQRAPVEHRLGYLGKIHDWLSFARQGLDSTLV